MTGCRNLDNGTRWAGEAAVLVEHNDASLIPEVHRCYCERSGGSGREAVFGYEPGSQLGLNHVANSGLSRADYCPRELRKGRAKGIRDLSGMETSG